MFFKKKIEKKVYDKTTKKPIIKASICTGEQVAGFKDIATGSFEEIMLIKDQEDLVSFRAMVEASSNTAITVAMRHQKTLIFALSVE